MKLTMILPAMCVWILPKIALAALPLNPPPHLDKTKLPYGCGSCHVGFSFKTGGGMTGCTTCHGSPSKRKKGAMAAGLDLKDVEAEFRKTYRHPAFDVKGVHSSKEILPETDPKATRHAECVDCHDPHLVAPENKFAGLKVRRNSPASKEIAKEFDLCYLCHGESANLPGRSTNKKLDFATHNASYHPVEAEGRNATVLSLMKPYREKKVNGGEISMISCSDCHGSDDPSSPRGPHGSTNQYILVDNFSTRDNEPESNHTYALCYRCHSRSSILGNESFKLHSRHIAGKSGGSGGTSCHTCHDSHGSAENRYLIKFNPEIVGSNSAGLLKFVSKGPGSFHGECYLRCHGVSHDPKTY